MIVAGGLILNSILPVLPWLHDVFAKTLLWIGKMPGQMWDAITADYSVPGWLALIVGLFALTGFLLLCIAFLILTTPKHKPKPAYRKYTEDIIDGLRWRWSWDGSKISHLWCFCLSCDAQLVVGDNLIGVALICERCPSDGSLHHDGPFGHELLARLCTK